MNSLNVLTLWRNVVRIKLNATKCHLGLYKREVTLAACNLTVDILCVQDYASEGCQNRDECEKTMLTYDIFNNARLKPYTLKEPVGSAYH